MSVIFLLIVSYLLGSIPTALIVGKLGYGVDVRTIGSGNLGGTNVLRNLGKTAGIIVIAVDILKGVLATALPLLFHVHLHPVLAGIPAVIGHCYPIFANFRGGKAVATSAGVLLFASPILFLTAVVVFAITLFVSKFVSLSSIIAVLWAHLYALIWFDKVLAIATFALVILILYRHRSNIERIVNGTESKVPWL